MTTTAPIANPTRVAQSLGTKRVVIAVGAVLALVGLAVGTRSIWGSSKHHATRTRVTAPQPEYPAAGRTKPASINVVYDAAKDRTRMSLDLGFAATDAGSGHGAGELRLVLVSEYKGKARPADFVEGSAMCHATRVTSQAGALAPSSPPAVFTADGAAIDARAAFAGKSGYAEKRTSGGTRETLEFRVRTRDLVTLCNAKSVKARVGNLDVTLAPGQLADLREFVARMKPGS